MRFDNVLFGLAAFVYIGLIVIGLRALTNAQKRKGNR